MNITKLLNAAAKLHASATPFGKCKIAGQTYLFSFTQNGNYHVTGPEIDLNFNTRSLTQAKKWLREYLAN